MPLIVLSSLAGPEIAFLMEIKNLADQRGYLPEIEELWSDAKAEGEIRDGPLLNVLIRVATEESRGDNLQALFE